MELEPGLSWEDQVTEDASEFPLILGKMLFTVSYQLTFFGEFSITLVTGVYNLVGMTLCDVLRG